MSYVLILMFTAVRLIAEQIQLVTYQ
jgi:hypothetical protein